MVPRRRALGQAGLAVVAVLAATILTLWPFPAGSSGAPSPAISVRDASADLGPVFHPGIILGAASNGSATLLGGIGVYVRSPEFSLPVLASISNGTSGIAVTNLTAEVAADFFEGGVYGLGWNGSTWLVAGQASWGGGNFGALVALNGTTAVNLTGELHGAFDGGGIFALGWNGTGWLLGGNSSQGPVLVALQGNKSVDLSAHLASYDPLGWIQLIAWNGTSWLIGGEGVLGVLDGARYTDLWLNSPYAGQGVYAAGWNGTAWLVGGGGAKLVLVRGSCVSPGPTLPSGFDQAALLVIPVAGGWLVGGKGSPPGGGFAPALAFWPGGPSAVRDLSSLLPSSFAGGEIQGGVLGPELGPRSIVTVGEGAYQQATGHGLGSVAILTWSG